MSSDSQRRGHLRRIPSNLIAVSLLTRTNTTLSDIPGPGRTLGRILYAGGRRLEPILSRAANAIGYGPSAVVRKILALVERAHIASPNHRQTCSNDDSKWLFPSVPGISDTTILSLVYVVCRPCRGCLLPVLHGSTTGRTVKGLLGVLLKYTR